MSDLQSEWEAFFQKARLCKDCRGLKIVKNILSSIGPNDLWGLAWYDKYRNLDAGLMVVGMDFGNEEMVRKFRTKLKYAPTFQPNISEDKSYVRLRDFLTDAGIGNRAFVTNAALCVRIGSAKISGELPSQVYTNCVVHLRRQINLAKPYIIVALGNRALESVWDALKRRDGAKGVTQIAGQQLPVKIHEAEILVIPAIHPNRAQEGWTDDRQRREIYRPLKQLLTGKDVAIGRSKFRELFGDLPYLN